MSRISRISDRLARGSGRIILFKHRFARNFFVEKHLYQITLLITRVLGTFTNHQSYELEKKNTNGPLIN